MREFEMLPYPKGNQSGKLMSDACAVGPLKRTFQFSVTRNKSISPYAQMSLCVSKIPHTHQVCHKSHMMN